MLMEIGKKILQTKNDVEEFIRKYNRKKKYQSLLSFLLRPSGKRAEFKLNPFGGSYTDDKVLVVGFDESYYGLTEAEMDVIGESLVVHEAQHMLSSNFPEFKRYIVEETKKMVDLGYMQQFAQNFVHSIGNICEDGRIERIASRKLAGAGKKLQFKNLHMWKGYTISPEENKIAIITNTLLSLAKVGLYPQGYSVKNYPEVDEAIEKIKPNLVKAVTARTCKDGLDECREIIEILEPYLREDYEQMKNEMEQMQELMEMLQELVDSSEFKGSQEIETNDGDSEDAPSPQVSKIKIRVKKQVEESEDDEQESQDQAQSEESDEEEPNKEMNSSSDDMKEEQGDDSDEDSTGNSNGDSDDDSDEESDDDSTGNSSDDSDDDSDEESDDDSTGNSSDDSEDDSDDASDEDSTGNSGGDSEDDSEDDSDDESDEDSTGNSGGDSEDDSDEDSDDESEEDSKGRGPSNEEHEVPEQDLTEEEVRELFKQLSKEVSEEASVDLKPAKETAPIDESLTPKEIASLKTGFVEYKRTYPLKSNVPNEVRIHGKKFKSEIKKIFQNRRSMDFHGQVKGVLNQDDLYRTGMGEYDVFTVEGPKNKSDFAVYVLQDGSGSMSGINEKHSAYALSIFEEGLKEYVSLKEVTFNCNGSVVHNVIKNWSENDKKNYAYSYLMNRKANNWNEDGISIDVATMELMKRPESQKILIVLSDGLPSNTEYVKEAVKNARNKGIHVFGIMFGDSQFQKENMPAYTHMYQYNIIATSPSRIPEKLIQVFKTVLKHR